MDETKRRAMVEQTVKGAEELAAGSEIKDPVALSIYLRQTVGSRLDQMMGLAHEGMDEEDLLARQNAVVETMRARLFPDKFEAWHRMMQPRMEERIRQVRQQRAEHSPPHGSLERVSVLVGETDEVGRRLMGTLVAGSGVDVTYAESGVAFLERLGERDYDFAVLTTLLSEPDFVELIRAVRESGRNGKAIIVVAAAYPNELREKLAGLEPVETIRRPYVADDLARIGILGESS